MIRREREQFTTEICATVLIEVNYKHFKNLFQDIFMLRQTQNDAESTTMYTGLRVLL